MDAETRLNLITGAAQEVVGVEHLMARIEDGGTIRAYVGFEPSGKAHVGWKVLSTNLRRMLDADVNVLIFLADWHAYINDKFGRDMDKIGITAKYMEEVFRVLLDYPKEGDGPGELRFKYASELVDNSDYWFRVIQCAKNMSLSRAKRTFSIMGRDEESGEHDLSKFFYPAMQAADIFEMDIDLAIGGMDQRKAHMYMRDVADQNSWSKPTCIHTPIISSLKGETRMETAVLARGSISVGGSDSKMSKSDPSSAILLHDTPGKLRKKMRKAYLDVEKDDSPIYELLEHIILPEQGQIIVTPNPEYGEPSTYDSLEGFITAVQDGTVHPLDAKFAVADAISSGLDTLRSHFESNPQLLDSVNEITGQ